MARTSLTRNLKLRVSSDLTADAKYNLEKIDSLAGVIQLSTENDTIIRSAEEISFEPNSPDVGGTGVGGTVNFGSINQPLESLDIFAASFSISGAIALKDTASGGTKNLNLTYKSDLAGPIDSAASRTLTLDVQGANRTLILEGDLSLFGGSLTLNVSGPTSLTLPISGTIATLAGGEVLTNKTIAAGSNTITGLTNSNIASGAAIDGSKIAATFGNQPVESSDRLRLTNGSYTVSLKQASSGQTTNLSWEFPSTQGANGQVLTSDGSGSLLWTNSTSSSLSGITDVNITAPVTGQFLIYNSGTSTWNNQKPYYSTTWLPGEGSSKTAIHNLGTTNVLVQIVDESGYVIDVPTQITGLNTVSMVSSDTPTGTWNVLIYSLL